MQPQSARAVGVRSERRRRGGRGAAPLQHDRGVRQPVAGNAGDARLADLPRGDRGFDRARHACARLRRARLHRRLRQDRPCRADGPGEARQARRGALQRPDAGGAPARAAAHGPGRLGGGRCRGARPPRRDELDELERLACPGPGTCAGHFTANTMAVALDCLGIAVLGDGTRRPTICGRRARPPRARAARRLAPAAPRRARSSAGPRC